MRGVYVGKTSIRHAFDQFGPQGLREGERNDHVYLQTLVSVAQDGRTANARGVEVVMSSTRGGELSEGVFENSFVKQGGGWKIQSVHFYPRMIVDAATGWAKSAKPAPGPSKDFPPDRRRPRRMRSIRIRSRAVSLRQSRHGKATAVS